MARPTREPGRLGRAIKLLVAITPLACFRCVRRWIGGCWELHRDESGIGLSGWLHTGDRFRAASDDAYESVVDRERHD